MSIKTILKRWTDTSLMLRILVGLVIGAVFGLIVPQWTFLDIPGQVFVSALKGIAPVLVAVLVSASIAKAGGGLGPRFKIVISRYMLSTFIAALLAVVGSFLFPITLNLSEAVNGSAPKSLVDVFMNLLISMVENPVKAVANANYIGILFWSIIVGISLKLVANGKTISVVQDFADVITLAVKWIIQFAPFGIFGLVFSSVAENGLDIFTTYGHLLLLLVGCMLANTMISNPFISFLMLKKNPYPLLFTCLKESGLNAFFTRSSAANIPINMGAAVTIAVMTLAVTHTMGIDVTFGAALFLCVIATLGACGCSGVAGGSLLLIPMACSFFGVSNDIAMQAVGVGFIIGVVQDSVETALNSSGDVFFTATAEYYERMKLKK